MQESSSSSSSVLPKQTSNERQEPHLYFLEHSESLRVILLVVPSLGSSEESLKKIIELYVQRENGGRNK